MSDDPSPTALDPAVVDAALRGLTAEPKWLPAKLFYDERGSRLFDRITELDEYYPTRTELSILQDHIDSIARHLHGPLELIELGSGSSIKTRLLLDHLDNLTRYVPVDISESHLAAAVEQLRDDYPKLEIDPVVADYTLELPLSDGVPEGLRRVVFFPGSTIGNLAPRQAEVFLASLARVTGPGGGLLIGFDLQKDPAVLERAYNDEAGVTAAFNRNVLVRLNREAGADFDPDRFRHHAYYNSALGRIEMHLISRLAQTVTVAGKLISFRQGESIHTESSYKYSPEAFRQVTANSFSEEETWTDARDYFAVSYLSVSGQERNPD